MKIIRYSQSCDVEVDMDVNRFGEVMNISWKTEDGVQSTKVHDFASTFRTLHAIYMNEKGVKLPAKFVLEFALMTINELTSAPVEYTPTAEAAR